MITQDPQDVAEPVFKQVNTTIVLNLGDEDAISSVNIPRISKQGAVHGKGQMVVYSPDNSEPVELVGLSTCVTRHGETDRRVAHSPIAAGRRFKSAPAESGDGERILDYSVMPVDDFTAIAAEE